MRIHLEDMKNFTIGLLFTDDHHPEMNVPTDPFIINVYTPWLIATFFHVTDYCNFYTTVSDDVLLWSWKQMVFWIKTFLYNYFAPYITTSLSSITSIYSYYHYHYINISVASICVSCLVSSNLLLRMNSIFSSFNFSLSQWLTGIIEERLHQFTVI